MDFATFQVRKADMWSYGTDRYIRIISPDSATRKERAKSTEYWIVYQSCAGLFGERQGVLPYRQLSPDWQKLVKQASGCEASAWAMLAADVGESAVATELKKEYLKEHLKEVKNLLATWMVELKTPSLLVRDQGQLSWGWPMIHKPSSEHNPDSNHMIRRHLRSRALWSHHANWERKLESIWQLTGQVRDDIKKKHVEQSSSKQWRYAEDYVNTALWQGFEVACGRTLSLDYKVPDSKIGLSFGAYLIENSATSAKSRALLEKEHREFIRGVAATNEMKDLVSLWNEVAELQEAMRAIAINTLKSSDILYPCKFCKHLWK